MIKKLLLFTFIFSFSVQNCFSWQDTIYESDTLKIIASHEGIDLIKSDNSKLKIATAFTGGLVSDGIYISPNEKNIVYQSEERNLILYNIPNEEPSILRPVLYDQEYYEKYLSKNTESYEYQLLDYPEDEKENIFSISWSPDSKKILIVSEFSEAYEVFYCIHDIDNFENPECQLRGIQAVYVGDKERFHINNEGEISVENSVYPEIDNITTSPFTDLLPTHLLYDHVIQAVEDEWINGYPDNTIQLEKTVNRAEFAKMLIKAFKHSDGDNTNLRNFPDVEINAWYAPLLSRAVELGLMKGYSDGTMKPNQTINTAEALKMSLSLLSQEIPGISGQWFEKYRSFATNSLSLKSMNLDTENMSTNITRGMAIELISLVKGLE